MRRTTECSFVCFFACCVTLGADDLDRQGVCLISDQRQVITSNDLIRPRDPVGEWVRDHCPGVLSLDGEKLATFAIYVVIAYTLLRNILLAASRPFWFDEINTVIVAGQPTLGKLWYALLHAEDSGTLLFSLIEHVCALAIPKAEIAYRLPSILGFGIVTWCLFTIVRTRSGPGIAFVCAILPMCTQLYFPYPVEARSYVLAVACIAFALLCYQRADQKRWLIALGASLFVAEALHSYAFFMAAPLFVAEFAQSLWTRRIRWGVWTALLAVFLPLAAAWPLLRRMKQFYGANFWGKPTWALALAIYGMLLRVPYLMALLGIVMLAAVSLLTIFIPRWGRGFHLELSSANEHIAAAVFLGLPLIEFVGTKLANSAFTLRYGLATILGVSIASGYALRLMGRRILFVAGCTVLLLLVTQEAVLWQRSWYRGWFLSPATAVEDMIKAAGHTDLPVVVSDGQDYMPVAYYASPDWARRFVVLVDPASSVEYVGNDSVDRQMLALQCCFPLQIQDFQGFSPNHPQFLMYSGGGLFDWWPQRLSHDGYKVEPLVIDSYRKVDLVTRVQ